ncbi:MAG: nucleotidyltransferase family protein [Cypionkella sp.]|uniref:nucleotidyltransferase family protein n=1 Tax=Cypionkella sp. TaxID=2811411 RepID=UPI002AB8EB44|nr:nucleotidyltransferase family protein [Cypionkella sp.]MDZ4312869.1 nucleotidyltransferase family protein [Cypionkella sp.]
MTLTILIPAAGAASRMQGGDKLLELVDAEPMLRRQARVARLVCPRVIVTLRVDDLARMQVLAGLDLTILAVPDAAEGMAASIRAGAAAAPGALMILPADMPDIDATDLATMIDAFDQAPQAILRGTSADGRPGHPVIIPAELRTELQSLRGDQGARSVFALHHARIKLIALPDQHALTDLDTPEAWAAWRARRQG